MICFIFASKRQARSLAGIMLLCLRVAQAALCLRSCLASLPTFSASFWATFWATIWPHFGPNSAELDWIKTAKLEAKWRESERARQAELFPPIAAQRRPQAKGAPTAAKTPLRSGRKATQLQVSRADNWLPAARDCCEAPSQRQASALPRRLGARLAPVGR